MDDIDTDIDSDIESESEVEAKADRLPVEEPPTHNVSDVLIDGLDQSFITSDEQRQMHDNWKKEPAQVQLAIAKDLQDHPSWDLKQQLLCIGRWLEVPLSMNNFGVEFEVDLDTMTTHAEDPLTDISDTDEDRESVSAVLEAEAETKDEHSEDHDEKAVVKEHVNTPQQSGAPVGDSNLKQVDAPSADTLQTNSEEAKRPEVALTPAYIVDQYKQLYSDDLRYVCEGARFLFYFANSQISRLHYCTSSPINENSRALLEQDNLQYILGDLTLKVGLHEPSCFRRAPSFVGPLPYYAFHTLASVISLHRSEKSYPEIDKSTILGQALRAVRGDLTCLEAFAGVRLIQNFTLNPTSAAHTKQMLLKQGLLPAMLRCLHAPQLVYYEFLRGQTYNEYVTETLLTERVPPAAGDTMPGMTAFRLMGHSLEARAYALFFIQFLSGINNLCDVINASVAMTPEPDKSKQEHKDSDLAYPRHPNLAAMRVRVGRPLDVNPAFTLVDHLCSCLGHPTDCGLGRNNPYMLDLHSSCLASISLLCTDGDPRIAEQIIHSTLPYHLPYLLQRHNCIGVGSRFLFYVTKYAKSKPSWMRLFHVLNNPEYRLIESIYEISEAATQVMNREVILLYTFCWEYEVISPKHLFANGASAKLAMHLELNPEPTWGPDQRILPSRRQRASLLRANTPYKIEIKSKKCMELLTEGLDALNAADYDKAFPLFEQALNQGAFILAEQYQTDYEPGYLHRLIARAGAATCAYFCPKYREKLDLVKENVFIFIDVQNYTEDSLAFKAYWAIRQSAAIKILIDQDAISSPETTPEVMARLSLITYHLTILEDAPAPLKDELSPYRVFPDLRHSCLEIAHCAFQLTSPWNILLREDHDVHAVLDTVRQIAFTDKTVPAYVNGVSSDEFANTNREAYITDDVRQFIIGTANYQLPSPWAQSNAGASPAHTCPHHSTSNGSPVKDAAANDSKSSEEPEPEPAPSAPSAPSANNNSDAAPASTDKPSPATNFSLVQIGLAGNPHRPLILQPVSKWKEHKLQFCSVCRTSSYAATIRACALCRKKNLSSSALYCSSYCQRADWKQHKKEYHNT